MKRYLLLIGCLLSVQLNAAAVFNKALNVKIFNKTNTTFTLFNVDLNNMTKCLVNPPLNTDLVYYPNKTSRSYCQRPINESLPFYAGPRYVSGIGSFDVDFHVRPIQGVMLYIRQPETKQFKVLHHLTHSDSKGYELEILLVDMNQPIMQFK